MFEKIKARFMKPKTFQERYTQFLKEIQNSSAKHGIDVIPTLSFKDLLAETTPTPEVPTPVQEVPVAPKSKKGGKKSGK